MDGLDTLSQVALDPVNIANLCFDTTTLGGGRLPSESFDDCLNTPVTSNSDVTFFGCDPLGPVPITATGMYSYLIDLHRAMFDQLFGSNRHTALYYTLYYDIRALLLKYFTRM